MSAIGLLDCSGKPSSVGKQLFQLNLWLKQLNTGEVQLTLCLWENVMNVSLNNKQ